VATAVQNHDTQICAAAGISTTGLNHEDVIA
jgi:hypothetical protein